MPGQLALAVETEAVVAAAVWETLPPERQLQVGAAAGAVVGEVVGGGAR
ncbi:MAG: hypothetical protein JO363_10780 [Solirubrobacterales bacterium]|nr:hypothetical protein [Solirubrobacterales bacterium]